MGWSTRIWARYKRFEKVWGLSEETKEMAEERRTIWDLWKRLSDGIRTPQGGCDPYDLELLEETATWRLLSMRLQAAAAAEVKASGFVKANALLESMSRARARYRAAIHELTGRINGGEAPGVSLSKLMQPIMEKGLPLVKRSLVVEEDVEERVEELAEEGTRGVGEYGVS
ncbi:MAG: hypothetical protein AAB353_02650 [Candidatus Hydrogenedentota bacterium]